MTDVSKQLSLLDRYLPLWIILAMTGGIALSHFYPSIGIHLDAFTIDSVSLPIAIGLLVMMYPPLAKVRYGALGAFFSKWKTLNLSLGLNWILGPLLMTSLAWMFLSGEPEFRNGIILVGIARCIAMVLIWNTLACGSGEIAAILVALNSLFQIIMYSFYGWLFLTFVPSLLGQSGTALDISVISIAKSVLIFLGIPFGLGFLSRMILSRMYGEVWYEQRFIPFISPLALIGLLYTIVLIFAMQGEKLIEKPLSVMLIALPLFTYFIVMFCLSMWLSYKTHHTYEESAAISFTASGNNFELAIAVAIGTFGISSGEALAATVGPLIEVPALVLLVYVSLWSKSFFHTHSSSSS